MNCQNTPAISGLHTIPLRDSNNEFVDGLRGYIFQNKNVKSQLDRQAVGTKVYSISYNSIKECLVPIPTKIEQRAIAEVLSDIDSLIEVLDKKIAKKRAIKDGAMQQLLSPKTNWKTCKLGEICEITMGQSPSSDSYNEDGCGILLVQGNADISNRRINKRTWTTQPSKYSGENAIIMTVRAPVGYIAMSLENCCLGRGVCALNNGEINKWFLYYLLIFNEHKWSILEQGSTFTSANSKQIYDFEISYPDNPIEEIKTATILLDMDAEIELLEQQRSKYTSLKQGAMQQLLTGQIRLVADRQIRQTDKSSKQANVHFKRSVWAAEIVDRLCNEPTFGHVKMEKMIFLTEHLCGVEIGSNYHRDAAGPYDNRAIRSIDSQLKKQNWFEAKREEWAIRYIPLPKRGGHKDYFNKYFSDVEADFDKVINTFRNWNTERCEIVATLYSAWKDIASAQKSYSDEDIINEVLNNWHESKKRIPIERWQLALNWMREKGFGPKL